MDITNQSEWQVKLDRCDFVMARDDVSRSLEMLRKEGEDEGGQYYISPAFSSALKAFYTNPAFETAVTLLEVAPAFLPMFEFNSPKNPLFTYGLTMYDDEDEA